MTIKLTDTEVSLLKELIGNSLTTDEGMGDWNKTSKRILKKLNKNDKETEAFARSIATNL